MDKLTQYQNLIKQILTEYQTISSQVTIVDVDEVLMFDDERSQYLWFNIVGNKGKELKEFLSIFALKMTKFTLKKI
jgi:XisI protein